jgi:hypothetical protein
LKYIAAEKFVVSFVSFVPFTISVELERSLVEFQGFFDLGGQSALP